MRWAILIGLIALGILVWRWPDIEKNNQEYNDHVCAVWGKTPATCGKGTAHIFGWEVEFK